MKYFWAGTTVPQSRFSRFLLRVLFEIDYLISKPKRRDRLAGIQSTHSASRIDRREEN